MNQQEKIDRVVLALIWMSRSPDCWEMPNGESVWHARKTFDAEVLARLEARGLISDVSERSNTLTLNDAGERKARALFEELFGGS